MKKLKKYLAVFSACSLALTGLVSFGGQPVVPVQAENAKNIVVIGDGISSGAKLPAGEKSYVDWIQYYTNAEIQNFAQDNNTTAEVLQSLDDAQVKAALANADIILVTAGLNDIMVPFFEVANSYMEEFGFERFADVFSANLSDYGFTSEDDLVPYANKLAAAARSNKTSANENFLAITEALSEYNNATIIYQTVYNPANTIENMDQLSAKRQQAYRSVCNPLNTIMNQAFNNDLKEMDGVDNVLVVDVFADFVGYAYKYTNLNDLDPNPSAEGHIRIADMVMEKAGLEKQNVPETPTESTTSETTTTTTTTTSTTPQTTTTTTTSTMPQTTTTTTTSTMPQTTTTTTTSTMPQTTTTTTTSTTTQTTTTTTTSTTTQTTTTTTTSTTPQTTTTTTTSTTPQTTTTTTTSTTPQTTATTETSAISTTEPTKTEEKGDLNNDNQVNASDAAIILKAAANIGANKSSGLSPELEQAADVDNDPDHRITASDAAVILVYAAKRGTNQVNISFAEYLKTLGK